MKGSFVVSSEQIVRARPPKNSVDPTRPYAFFVERERTAHGTVEDVATIFLTNRECPFRCLMCDLWKNTTDLPLAPGLIPRQIDHALKRLPPARHLKLYNSGNFFDRKAIPRDDYAAIASRVRRFSLVTIENHPRLCTAACLDFSDRLGTRLEIAMGLETVHAQALLALNKQMTLDDFSRAARMLVGHGIDVRAFILLRPPLVSDSEAVEWAVRSLEFAFAAGSGCASVIPTRGGNGMMETLREQGLFGPPSLASLEAALAAGIELKQGRVFADLWDVERLFGCSSCGPPRANRMRQMNLTQQVLPAIHCHCG